LAILPVVVCQRFGGDDEDDAERGGDQSKCDIAARCCDCPTEGNEADDPLAAY